MCLVDLLREFEIPGSKLILSGFSGSGELSHAEVMAESALFLGVNPRDTFLMPQPTITYEEAKCYIRRFGKEKRLILVTSANHMPRAMLVFQSHGLYPIQAPAAFYYKIGTKKGVNWLSAIDNVKNAQIAIQELIGILYTRYIVK